MGPDIKHIGVMVLVATLWGSTLAWLQWQNRNEHDTRIRRIHAVELREHAARTRACHAEAYALREDLAESRRYNAVLRANLAAFERVLETRP